MLQSSSFSYTCTSLSLSLSHFFTFVSLHSSKNSVVTNNDKQISIVVILDTRFKRIILHRALYFCWNKQSLTRFIVHFSKTSSSNQMPAYTMNSRSEMKLATIFRYTCSIHTRHFYLNASFSRSRLLSFVYISFLFVYTFPTCIYVARHTRRRTC